MRTGIDEAVTVRRATAEISTLVACLHGHRGPHPDPGAGDLPLGQDAEHDHQLFLPADPRVDGSTQFRHPHLDAVVVEERSHGRELVAVEGPFTGADDNGSNSRSGSAIAASSAAAWGRRAQGMVRLRPVSKNSETIRQCPDTRACAPSSCQACDVAGS
ncbi:hypothetical protein [Streptomyces sp. FXJ1.172]|uniref:hypothetical protein n=1 Tax=Streptomyces sp. FXJ1.172 TaxID=710705 RepID=UPI0007CF0B13|nr:hypothetical protein [Streptomyces sp. FXJ1.172]WEO94313.1 hypothetical protein A6P39_010015 [Streptomyces sp. FXJ1.172]